MANNWRLLKTMDDVNDALDYMFNNNKLIEILVWDEQTKQARISKIDRSTRYNDEKIFNNALAWRLSEDEEKFKKFLAKLDTDYDAYVLNFSGLETSAQRHATSAAIRESLRIELPLCEADYFVFEIVGSRLIVLIDNAMNFDIPTMYITRIQKTIPSYAAHDNCAFAKALKEQREKLEDRFFGADVAAHYCGYDANVTKRLVKFLGAEEND